MAAAAHFRTIRPGARVEQRLAGIKSRVERPQGVELSKPGRPSCTAAERRRIKHQEGTSPSAPSQAGPLIARPQLARKLQENRRPQPESCLLSPPQTPHRASFLFAIWVIFRPHWISLCIHCARQDEGEHCFQGGAAASILCAGWGPG